jgi:hypothetical protein
MGFLSCFLPAMQTSRRIGLDMRRNHRQTAPAADIFPRQMVCLVMLALFVYSPITFAVGPSHCAV